MNCPCGGSTREKEHQVRTLGKALEWSSEVKSEDLPVTIEQNECEACGRLKVRVFSFNGRLITSRG